VEPALPDRDRRKHRIASLAQRRPPRSGVRPTAADDDHIRGRREHERRLAVGRGRRGFDADERPAVRALAGADDTRAPPTFPSGRRQRRRTATRTARSSTSRT